MSVLTTLQVNAGLASAGLPTNFGILAQDAPVQISNGDGNAINFVPSQGVQDACKKLAFGLIAIWIIRILAFYAMPSQKYQNPGNRIGWMKFAISIVAAIILMDLTLLPALVNWTIRTGQQAMDSFSG